MSPQVSIDPELCVGTGDCERLAPRAFRLNDALSISEALPGVAETELEVLIAAARQCPTMAIRVVADDGEVLVESN